MLESITVGHQLFEDFLDEVYLYFSEKVALKKYERKNDFSLILRKNSKTVIFMKRQRYKILIQTPLSIQFNERLARFNIKLKESRSGWLKFPTKYEIKSKVGIRKSLMLIRRSIQKVEFEN